MTCLVSNHLIKDRFPVFRLPLNIYDFILWYVLVLGKLLVLTGDPEGARPYLKTSIETAGDSKYREFSEKKLAEIDQQENYR